MIRPIVQYDFYIGNRVSRQNTRLSGASYAFFYRRKIFFWYSPTLYFFFEYNSLAWLRGFEPRLPLLRVS